VTGRRVDVSAGVADRRSRGRWIALGLGVLVLLSLGVAIGSRIAARSSPAPRPSAVTVTVPTTGQTVTPRSANARYPMTRHGAVAAASAYVSALGGPALLSPTRVRSVVRAIASPSVRDRLAAAYVQAAVQAREQLGVGTIPAPVVILRAAPVGYRVESFRARAATIAIWRVGVVGSGAGAEPEQSWRTERVSLVWEHGVWKVASLASEPGPTPPLVAAAASTPAELFASIQRFEEFSRVDP
jgi:hypothetical protein